MQIILVQQEVEQALRDYVASRLTLTEGTVFEIDLAATRGANGITATINLVQPGAQIATQAAVAAPAVARKSTPEAPTKAPETTAVVQSDPNVAEAPSAPVETPVDPVAPPVEEQEQKQLDPNQQTGEETPAPKSLFAALQRPKNS